MYETPGKIIFYSDFTLTRVMHISYSFFISTAPYYFSMCLTHHPIHTLHKPSSGFFYFPPSKQAVRISVVLKCQLF